VSKKKILIVAATFYPYNSPRANRTTELAKEFSKQGHAVTVITPKNDACHLPFEQKHQITIRDLGARKFKQFSINGSRFASLFGRLMNRGLNLLFEYPDIELTGLVKRALQKEHDYDLLVSIAVPHPVHWGVAAVRSQKHPIAKVWVADCGDPYMLNRLDSFNKLFYFKYFERQFCKKADFLTVPTLESKGGYFPEFHAKIKVIPQGFNFDDTPIHTGEVKNEVPTFGYAGTFIPGSRDPRELLDFLCKLNKPFKFIIYTADTALVEPFVKESGNKIEIRSYIPRKELIYELSQMDFVVNFTNGTALVTPSKLIDYAITKRPILSVDTGKLATSTVLEFLNGEYQHQFKIDNVEKYYISNVAKSFVELLK
jgi:glycosyltransferase involved in cell wall biosynthesis